MNADRNTDAPDNTLYELGDSREGLKRIPASMLEAPEVDGIVVMYRRRTVMSTPHRTWAWRDRADKSLTAMLDQVDAACSKESQPS